MLIFASIGFFFRLLLYALVPKIEGTVKKTSRIESICIFLTFELLGSCVIEQAARLIALPKIVIDCFDTTELTIVTILVEV